MSEFFLAIKTFTFLKDCFILLTSEKDPAQTYRHPQTYKQEEYLNLRGGFWVGECLLARRS